MSFLIEIIQVGAIGRIVGARTVEDDSGLASLASALRPALKDTTTAAATSTDSDCITHKKAHHTNDRNNIGRSTNSENNSTCDAAMAPGALLATETPNHTKEGNDEWDDWD